MRYSYRVVHSLQIPAVTTSGDQPVVVVVVPVHHGLVVVVMVLLLQVQAATPSAAPKELRRSGSVPSDESSGIPKYFAHASLCCPPRAASLALRLSSSAYSGSLSIFETKSGVATHAPFSMCAVSAPAVPSDHNRFSRRWVDFFDHAVKLCKTKSHFTLEERCTLH